MMLLKFWLLSCIYSFIPHLANIHLALTMCQALLLLRTQKEWNQVALFKEFMIYSFMEVYMLTAILWLYINVERHVGVMGGARQFVWVSWSELHRKNGIYMTWALNKKKKLLKCSEKEALWSERKTVNWKSGSLNSSLLD